ncbi:MAG: acyl carrier protein [Panacagrimonas sp.]
MHTEQEIFEHLKGVLVELFEVEPEKIRLEAQLYQDLDIDSIDAIDLILKLKEMTGRKIQPEQFKHVRSVADVVRAVEAMMAEVPSET